MHWQWKFRLLRWEILLDAGRAEEVISQVRAAMPQGAEFAALRARTTMLESRAANALGNVQESLTLMHSAHQAAEAANAQDVLLDIEALQGIRLLLRGSYDESEAVLRKALARAQAIHAAYAEAAVQLNLGLIRARYLHYDEAIPYFQQASALAGPRAPPLYNSARVNLAMCYSQLGDHDRALQIHLQAVAESERSAAKDNLHNSLGETGRTYMSKADPGPPSLTCSAPLPWPRKPATWPTRRSGPETFRSVTAKSATGTRPPPLIRKQSA